MQTNTRAESRRRLLGLTLTLIASCSLGVAAAQAKPGSDGSFIERLLSYGWNETQRVEPEPGAPDSTPAPERKPEHRAARETAAEKTEAAMKIPAVAVPVEAMRAPLSDRDAALYKKIFTAQESGDWTGADSLIPQLGDKRLLGHVLYQRYMHPTAYRAQFEELRDWLSVYADHPGAQRLYALALARMPSGGGSADLRKPAPAGKLRLPVSALPGEHRSAQSALTNWVRGMNAWRNENYKNAAHYFGSTADGENVSDWTRAAAAFWASRAHMRAGNLKEVSPWLRRAAQYPRTFYGLIATRALGESFDFNWKLPDFTGARYERLVSIPQGARAVALAAAGQQDRAEEELRMIDPGDDGELREAMLSFAAQARIPALAMELAHAIPARDGGVYDAALYPLMPWKPKDGFKVDPALIHAIMRQESKFDPEALSHRGARGLMQIMPMTARHVVAKRDLVEEDGGADSLRDPQANLEIGQHYIEELLDQSTVDRDLFSLAIAYNAGPGNLSRWKSRLRHVTDPLLFIESLPASETRAYVERVLANYWIYKLRMGQSVPTLDAVAAGQWARAEDATQGHKYSFFKFWE